jgi:hypothetical protein
MCFPKKKKKGKKKKRKSTEHEGLNICNVQYFLLLCLLFYKPVYKREKQSTHTLSSSTSFASTAFMAAFPAPDRHVEGSLGLNFTDLF